MNLRNWTQLTLLLTTLLALVGCSQDPPPQEVWERTAAWEPETLDAFGELPMQHGGRIKPLSTFAHYKLVRLSGKSKLKLQLPDGQHTGEEKLDGMGFLMDCLLFPKQARHYDCILVEDWALLDDLGGKRLERKKRRDVYSLSELEPIRIKLMTDASSLDQRIQTLGYKPTPFEQSKLQLASKMIELSALLDGLEFARSDLRVPPVLNSYFPEARPGLAWVLEDIYAFTEDDLDRLQTDPVADEPLRDFLNEFGIRSQYTSRELALFPSLETDVEASPDWMDPQQAITQVVQVQVRDDAETYLPALQALETIAHSRMDQPKLREAAGAFGKVVVPRAEARGEGTRIEMERTFNRLNLFTYANILFILGFILAAASWGASSRKLGVASWVAVLGGVLCVGTGIGFRCVINQRPPVTTLYETSLFICFFAVSILLVIERFDKRRLALGAAALGGITLMFLSFSLERRAAVSSGDTMVSLVAVLDTNFYLWIHVTTVTLGYAAGLAAWLVGVIWLIGHMCGAWKRDPALGKSWSGFLYGTICFGLLFSIFGTLMGGVWANDSWGRFWGWDPKENGALMICLWELMIVHSRLGGLVRQVGTAVLAVVGGCVVAFSWFHVNELGVGLHSYGSISAVKTALYYAYGLNASFLLIVGGHWLATRSGGNGGGTTPALES